MLGLALLAVAASSPVCGPAAAKTITANEVARVYRKSGKVYGCTAGGKRRLALEAERSVVLSGPYAATVGGVAFGGDGETDPVLRILDLRTDRTLWFDDLVFFDSVPALAVDATGRAVWIERRREGGRTVDDIVAYRRDHDEFHLVTERTGPLGELSVSGRTVAFDQAGRRVSAQLPVLPVRTVRATPARGTRRTRFTLSFAAPPDLGRSLVYAVSSTLTRPAGGGLSGIPCLVLAPRPGRRADGRITIDAGRPEAACAGVASGWVFATYGSRDGDCDAKPMPCWGSIRVGRFSVRVR